MSNWLYILPLFLYMQSATIVVSSALQRHILPLFLLRTLGVFASFHFCSYKKL